MKYIYKIPAALLAFSTALCCFSGCADNRGEGQSSSQQPAEETSAATSNYSAQSTKSALTETVPEATEQDITSEEVPEISGEWMPEIAQRQTINDSGNMCGIIYVGYIFDNGADATASRDVFIRSEYAQDIPEICNIPDENCVGTEGGEVYLVIPGKEEYTVTVYRWVLSEENDYTGEPGEVLYSSDKGTPFLLKCNVSDIMQDTLIEITDEAGNTSSWSPYLSLKDGTVGIDPGRMKVYDFTKYPIEPESDE